jgi:hypothetical protein
MGTSFQCSYYDEVKEKEKEVEEEVEEKGEEESASTLIPKRE